jgi:hypothetical protein
VTPPRTILIANVGQRDVQPDGKSIPREKSYRHETARLLKEVRAAPHDTNDHLHLPIIENAVRAVTHGGGSVAVVIYGTDQDPSQQQWVGDTIHAAEIIAALLPVRFPGIVTAAIARPLSVARADDHDLAFQSFRDELRTNRAPGRTAPPDPARIATLADLLGADPPPPIMVAVSSGTPAANLGLILAAVETHGERVNAIQPRDDGTVARINVAATIRRQAFTQPAVRLLESGEFGTAAAFLKAWGDRRANPIIRAARALHKWQDYDIAGAITAVHEAVATLHHVTGAAQIDLQNLIESLLSCLTLRKGGVAPGPEPTENQFADLLWIADLCRSQGRYVDLMARAARLNEAILRRTLRRALNVPNVEDWDRTGFWRAVHNAMPNYQKPERDQVNIPNMTNVLGALPTNIAVKHNTRAVFEASRIVGVAQILHNQSIAGHQFSSVNDGALRTRLGKLPGLDDATRARLTTDGAGGVILIEAMQRLLDAAKTSPPRTNFFLDPFGKGLADALVAIEA